MVWHDGESLHLNGVYVHGLGEIAAFSGALQSCSVIAISKSLPSKSFVCGITCGHGVSRVPVQAVSVILSYSLLTRNTISYQLKPRGLQCMFFLLFQIPIQPTLRSVALLPPSEENRKNRRGQTCLVCGKQRLDDSSHESRTRIKQ